MATAPALPKPIWGMVRDFLAPIDLYNFHETCTTFRTLVSVESVIKSAGAGRTAHSSGFWPRYDSDMGIFLRGVKAGKVYMPSAMRMLRIVLHADKSMNGKIGCDFCPSAEVGYFSSTRGILLCSGKCMLAPHKENESLDECLTWPYSDLTSGVLELLGSQPQSAAHVDWWKGKGLIYTTAEPVTDAVTGERCGCTITKHDLDAMARRPWSPEKLLAVLPDTGPSSEMDVLFSANKYASDYARRRFCTNSGWDTSTVPSGEQCVIS